MMKKKKKKETTTKFIFGLVTGHQWKNNKAVPDNNFPSSMLTIDRTTNKGKNIANNSKSRYADLPLLRNNEVNTNHPAEIKDPYHWVNNYGLSLNPTLTKQKKYTVTKKKKTPQIGSRKT